MEKVLRGHHLLCVHGFRGMGYNDGFVAKMKEIVEDIRNEEKDFFIQVVADLDQACAACPNRGETRCEASANSNEHVLTLDENVIHHLGLKKGESYLKSELVALTAKRVVPDDLDILCKNCSWLAAGVCKEGMANLRKKYKIKK
ncbi:hypothetical protein J2S13_001048 [Oikeobacillus pervagus]|uniref:DUF1284 domain-containing protein n=1 Tax=Oikeobacillus pervagus TaxID=1325931 RepID=A0AAJ1WK18_9BACI|nr:DUF1284 domain-containing protein [Oikeobacillus pervagus]MDQ0214651.1 hypothetical protein [Oikeobacillus pervagus]